MKDLVKKYRRSGATNGCGGVGWMRTRRSDVKVPLVVSPEHGLFRSGKGIVSWPRRLSVFVTAGSLVPAIEPHINCRNSPSFRTMRDAAIMRNVTGRNRGGPSHCVRTRCRAIAHSKSHVPMNVWSKVSWLREPKLSKREESPAATSGGRGQRRGKTFRIDSFELIYLCTLYLSILLP